jgi:ABC-type antimicrobial peptide transport system permease subunit
LGPEVRARAGRRRSDAHAERRRLSESLTLVAAGIVFGVPATLVLSRLVASRLFGVGPTDATTIAGAILLMVTLAAIAGLLPAQRAARVDPMLALRNE